MSAYRKTCQHYYCTSNPSSRERNCNPASLLKGVASIPHREKLGATYFQDQRRVWASSSHAEIYNTKYAPTQQKPNQQHGPRNSKFPPQNPYSYNSSPTLSALARHTTASDYQTKRVARSSVDVALLSQTQAERPHTALWNTLDISNNPTNPISMHKNNDSATQNTTPSAESNGA